MKNPFMPVRLVILVPLLMILSSLLLANNCSAPQPPQAPAAPGGPGTATGPTQPPAATATPAVSTSGRKDACKLLAGSELQAVQGEPLKDTKATNQAEGGFFVSQCVFMLPTLSKSVVLTVTAAGQGEGGRDPKEYWKEAFHRKAEAAGSKDRDREASKEKGVESRERGEVEIEQEKTPPEKVPGLGDEAFWAPSRVGGAIYVLKGDVFIRISVGGPDTPEVKMRKSKILAEKVLPRL